MIGENLVKDVTTTTTPDELQVRNGQDHQRVYDPELGDILRKILDELKKTNLHLSILTGDEL